MSANLCQQTTTLTSPCLSFRYSSLTPAQQEKALVLWQRQWDKFVSENALEKKATHAFYHR